MIPLNPCSAYLRTKQFVREEWDALFADHAKHPAYGVGGGWRGLLYANLAIIDPKRSYEFFAQKNFDPGWLDGGATRAWYLAYAAGQICTAVTRNYCGIMLMASQVLEVHDEDDVGKEYVAESSVSLQHDRGV